MDRIVKCTTADGNIRAVALIATDLVKDLGVRHQLSPRGKQALGEALMGALLVASNCKSGERINLRVEGSGYFKNVLVDAYPEAHVRGILTERETGEPQLTSPEGDALGPWGNGVLSVLRTKVAPGERPYIGTVPLVTGHLPKDLTFYWLQSEQIPSAVGLAVNLQGDQVSSAGAFLIQVLPNAADEEVELIQKQIQNYPEFASDLASKPDPVYILSRIFQGRQFTKLDERPVEFRCSCSMDRVRNSLLLLGLQELRAIQAQGQGALLQCDFCRTEYQVTSAMLAELIQVAETGPKPKKAAAPAKKKAVKKPAPKKKTAAKKRAAPKKAPRPAKKKKKR